MFCSTTSPCIEIYLAATISLCFEATIEIPRKNIYTYPSDARMAVAHRTCAKNDGTQFVYK